MLKTISIAALSGALFVSTPAAAQVDLDLGAGADVDLGVDVRVGEPYTYRGYRSGRWYPYEDPRRRNVYYDQYGGYDCYRAFQYTWVDGHRAKYESYWCYDDGGRKYEVERTRAVVRVR